LIQFQITHLGLICFIKSGSTMTTHLFASTGALFVTRHLGEHTVSQRRI